MAASPVSRRGCIVRPNAHDWKSCEGNTSAGSNPALSANAGDAPQVDSHLWRLYVSAGFSLPAWAHHSTSNQPHRARRQRLCRSPVCTATGTPTSTRRHGPLPIATATRAPRWRRHQQSPSATLLAGWAYTKSAPGPRRMPCPTRHLGSGRQMPERPLTKRERLKLDCLSGVFRRETKHSPSCRTRSSAK
jgi:hypothetical protein